MGHVIEKQTLVSFSTNGHLSTEKFFHHLVQTFVVRKGIKSGQDFQKTSLLLRELHKHALEWIHAVQDRLIFQRIFLFRNKSIYYQPDPWERDFYHTRLNITHNFWRSVYCSPIEKRKQLRSRSLAQNNIALGKIQIQLHSEALPTTENSKMKVRPYTWVKPVW